MSSVSIKIDVQQLKEAIYRLKPKEKIELVEELEKYTRRERWSPLVNKIRQRFMNKSISVKEIKRICEALRKSRYERTLRSS